MEVIKESKQKLLTRYQVSSEKEHCRDLVCFVHCYIFNAQNISWQGRFSVKLCRVKGRMDGLSRELVLLKRKIYEAKSIGSAGELLEGAPAQQLTGCGPSRVNHSPSMGKSLGSPTTSHVLEWLQRVNHSHPSHVFLSFLFVVCFLMHISQSSDPEVRIADYLQSVQGPLHPRTFNKCHILCLQ